MKNSTKTLLGVLGIIAVMGMYMIANFRAELTNLEKELVKGNGEMIQKSFPIDSFDEIEAYDEFDVILQQGDFNVEIEAESNLMDFFEIELKGSSLRLSTKSEVGFRNNRTPIARISLPSLKRAALYGAGSLKNKEVFEAEHAEFQILGSGDMDLNVDAEIVKTSISGSGFIKVKGNGDFFETSISGDGTVKAAGFESENANVRISGSGDVDLNATGHLDVNISGSGTIRYAVEPATINKRISGSGDIGPL